MVKTIFEYIGYLSAIVGLYIAVIELLNKREGKLSWHQIEKGINDIVNLLKEKGFYPDMIIGIGKGGAIIAGMLSTKIGYKPVYHVDRQICYRTSDGQPEYVKLIFGDLPVKKKNVLIVNGESNSGWTTSEVRKAVLDMQPMQVLTASIVALDRENKRKEQVSYTPDIYSILAKRRQIPPWK